ncbi:hypothetical protein F3Y22_tig00110931pilonHSYRG00025 [Hibiscus syriacus]|uniref:RING-CH-type domain-containing protein n=1 Tax=Hibiscus syriacus TaxID=106335 RepID=A0A6A2ZDT8_HIBSY|nr:hypothetical protein F3Y22_tig00110931pilonHSYRG00025 [Hibiscus syriacus]
MSSREMSHIDLEQGTHRWNGSDVSADEASVYSNADEGSCYSQFYSTTGGSYDDYSFTCCSDGEIGDVSGSGRVSSVSDCSVEVQIQSGANEIKLHLAKAEKDCRICHLGLESNSHESGVAIELGCSCKDDLAAAHKHCAEAWFKIRGNKFCIAVFCFSCMSGPVSCFCETIVDTMTTVITVSQMVFRVSLAIVPSRILHLSMHSFNLLDSFRTCEICHSIARNVVGVNEIELTEQPNETNSATARAATYSDSQSFWHGHRFLNFLLACMVFAFVISWLFHFHMPSS